MLYRDGIDEREGESLAQYLIRRLLIAGIVSVAIVTLLELALYDVARSDAENEAREDLNRFRASLQEILTLDVQLIRGMAGYVRARPNLSQAEFELIAQDLL
jgi:two-component system sensor histidine kinase ChiS